MGLDDAAANLAGAPEPVLQDLALAPARCRAVRSSVKRCSISSTASRLFRKTSRHMTGSEPAMRVKSRKPPAENLTTSARSLASTWGRCEVIASTLSWCIGSMACTMLPQARHRPAIFSTAVSSVPGGGVRMHQRSSKSSAKPASGPECSVPATGWPGTKCTPSGR
jgi:hypothetical protein